MMPLIMADPGEENIIRRVGGSPEMKKHLEDLGFTGGKQCHGDEHHRRQSDCEGPGVPHCHQQGNGSENHGLIIMKIKER